MICWLGLLLGVCCGFLFFGLGFGLHCFIALSLHSLQCGFIVW